MDNIPLTTAEARAGLATRHSAFQVNLNGVRGAVQQILKEWKGAGFFTEYTDHSFDHVLDMLNTLDWFIPDEDKDALTDADWLLLVLSIYLHDIGLLITRHEFDRRASNHDYNRFIANPILSGDKQREFEARLQQLSPDAADAVRYQEFVRHTHGKRVASWLSGQPLDDGGATATVARILGDLLEPLDETFRRDLALICESHTLDDIEDTNLYKVSRPYGGDEETANLQYVAIVLRTVDLIQITRRRAPSVLHQIINPANPLSQIEWQKQNAVRAVRAAHARDREGNVSPDLPSDTIEVHATFKEPAGFFALTSFLSYADREVQKSHAAFSKARKDYARPYKFNWRFVDSSNIDANGFLQESFEFELDQHKILDLLTGHTLYNNSAVVLRELTQNAIDAVRLQCHFDKTASEEVGHVEIMWRSSDRTLIVRDNGTGMSQRVVVDHLLKVGSSRYQDPKFKEENPDFHSISRFGIGVLSAFMVSDDVEITTCHPDDPEARRIALQSVHGKYLIKLLNKVSDADQLPMKPHGTEVKLTLRATADIGDVLDVARNWILFPRCRVTVTVDADAPVAIGYKSPKEALENYVEQTFKKTGYKREYKVEEYTRDGVTVAFALAKDELFQDWGFVSAGRNIRSTVDEDYSPVATCIEGVAVEDSSPGFVGRNIVAVANAVGPTAPRTNVARSALEDTDDHRRMLSTIYSIYADHVVSEIERLRDTAAYSLSRAVGVAPYISTPLISPQTSAAKPELLSDEMAKVPFILIEDGESRRNVSIDELAKMEAFITIESPLHRSIEHFVREAPTDITSLRLLTTLGNSTQKTMNGVVVCNMSSSWFADKSLRKHFEIVRAEASAENRTVQVQWKPRGRDGRWFSSSTVQQDLKNDDAAFVHMFSEAKERYTQGRRNLNREQLYVPLFDVQCDGLDLHSGFVFNGDRYLRSDVGLSVYLKSLLDSADSDKLRILGAHFLLLDAIEAHGWGWDIINEELIGRAMTISGFELFSTYISDVPKLIEAFRSSPASMFDPFAWDRRTVSDFVH